MFIRVPAPRVLVTDDGNISLKARIRSETVRSSLAQIALSALRATSGDSSIQLRNLDCCTLWMMLPEIPLFTSPAQSSAPAEHRLSRPLEPSTHFNLVVDLAAFKLSRVDTFFGTSDEVIPGIGHLFSTPAQGLLFAIAAQRTLQSNALCRRWRSPLVRTSRQRSTDRNLKPRASAR